MATAINTVSSIKGKGKGNRTKYNIPVKVSVNGKTIEARARHIRILEDGSQTCVVNLHGPYTTVRKTKRQKLYRVA